GATSITCGGRSWKKLARFCSDTDSVEDVFSASGAECSSSKFIVTALRSLPSRRPTYDHAAERVPPISENQSHMGHDKEDKNPHQPEVPDARFVITAEDRSQPMELHGLMNRPARQDR